MQTSIVDPVCWMDVATKSIAAQSEYKGQTYYFCSMGCKESFDEEPGLFIDENDEDETRPQDHIQS